MKAARSGQRAWRSTSWLLLPTCGLLLGLGACRLRKSEADAPGKDQPGVSSHCANGYSVASGPYRFENNQWGRDKASGGFEQCLLKRERDGQKQFGWTWHWPGEAPSVYAYPEVIWGWKPWTGGTSTDTRFPRRVSDIERLSLHYKVETEATGSYNLAPEVWLTQHRETSGKPSPELITAEIMFWVDYSGISRPAGEVVEEVDIDGAHYELWRMSNMSSNGFSWPIFSFKRSEIAREGTLNIHAFLQHMTSQGQINPRDYVASLEFGNEIVGGRGTTWLERFDIEAAP